MIWYVILLRHTSRTQGETGLHCRATKGAGVKKKKIHRAHRRSGIPPDLRKLIELTSGASGKSPICDAISFEDVRTGNPPQLLPTDASQVEFYDQELANQLLTLLWVRECAIDTHIHRSK